MGASERGNYVWCLVIVVILMGLGRATMWGGGELLKSLNRGGGGAGQLSNKMRDQFYWGRGS